LPFPGFDFAFKEKAGWKKDRPHCEPLQWGRSFLMPDPEIGLPGVSEAAVFWAAASENIISP